MKLAKSAIIALLLMGFNSVFAQTFDDVMSRGQVHGNFQLDMQYYREDSLIGAQAVPEDVLMNGFANINYTNGNFSAGFRYESYLNTMLGFPTQYKGNGIGYRYASFNNEELSRIINDIYKRFFKGRLPKPRNQLFCLENPSLLSPLGGLL